MYLHRFFCILEGQSVGYWQLKYIWCNAMNGMAVASLQAIYLQSSPHKNQIRVKNGD